MFEQHTKYKVVTKNLLFPTVNKLKNDAIMYSHLKVIYVFDSWNILNAHKKCTSHKCYTKYD